MRIPLLSSLAAYSEEKCKDAEVTIAVQINQTIWP